MVGHLDVDHEAVAEATKHAAHEGREARSIGVVAQLQARRSPVEHGEARRVELGKRDLDARVHLVEKGRDPRRYAMVAFGGAGPAHAARVARILGVPMGTVMSRLSRGRQKLRSILETGRATLLRRVK